MPIRFRCGKESCGQSIQVADAAAGKKVRCPRCGAILAVPQQGPKQASQGASTSMNTSAPVQQSSTKPPPVLKKPVPQQHAPIPGVRPPAASTIHPTPKSQPAAPVPLPAAGGHEPEIIGFADEPPVRPAAGQPPPPPDSSADGVIYCPECGRLMRADKQACPECGWVRGAPTASGKPARAAAPPTPWHQHQPLSPGAMAVECLKAVKYGASNYKSVAIMVGYSIVLIYILQFALFIITAILMFSKIGMLLIPFVLLFAFVILGGYYFRFSLDCIVSSLEGTDLAPDPPAFNFSSLWTTGWRAVGIAMVYILPVVTLPLLPLALLALGYSNDNRCFSVVWAFRAAMKRPGNLAMLWLVLLLWIAAMVIGVSIVEFILGILLLAVRAGTDSGFLTFLVSIPCNILIAIITYVFIAVIFRCIGLLGRGCPELTDMLPEQIGTGATAGYISAGVAASVLMCVVMSVILAFASGATIWDRLSYAATGGQWDAATANISQNRLAGVGNLIGAYTMDPAHLGQFPKNLAELENLTPDKSLFESPGLRDRKFIYIPGQFWSGKTADNILLYDPAVYYDADNKASVINVLLVSGDVETIPAGTLIHRLAAQKEPTTASGPAEDEEN